jgi:hypothetical protein
MMNDAACAQGVPPDPMRVAMAVNPLIPAMRPANKRNRPADEPMSNPPAIAKIGDSGAISRFVS